MNEKASQERACVEHGTICVLIAKVGEKTQCRIVNFAVFVRFHLALSLSSMTNENDNPDVTQRLRNATKFIELNVKIVLEWSLNLVIRHRFCLEP